MADAMPEGARGCEMNICLVSEYFPPFAPGGAEWSTSFLAARLALSQNVVVLTPNYGADAYTKAHGFVVDRFPMPFRMEPGQQLLPYGRLANPLFYAYSAIQIARRVLRHHPDVLHAQNKQSIVGTVCAGSMTGVPVVVTLRDMSVLCRYGICLNQFDTHPEGCDWRSYRKCLHDYLALYMPQIGSSRRAVVRAMSVYHRLDSLLKRAMLRRADAVVTVSDKAMRIYVSRGLDPRRTRVIYNPLPAAGAQRLAPRPSDTRPGILYAGKLSWGKGPHLLIEALPDILRTFSDRPIALTVAGQGPLRRHLEQRARDLQVHQVVRFLGQVSRDRMETLLAQADVVVVPSIVQEAFGRVALEALLAGAPVVASSRGGLPEIVEDGVTGLVVDPEPRQIADAVLEVLRTPEMRRQVEDAKEGLRRKFGEDVSAKHIEMYTELLATRGRQADV
jgi:glycosyltransferase involved in cell wall biosynthesis